MVPDTVPAAGAAAAPDGAISVREIRRREVDRFVDLALATSGAFERQLGLDERSERQFRALGGIGIWLLLGVLRLLHRSPVRFLMVEESGAPIGTTMAVLDGPWAYVAAVAVREDRRRRGIAQALVRRAEAIGREARKNWLMLEVDAENGPARHLYAKLGWSQGPTVRWWELPPEAMREGGEAARPASRKEQRLAHALAAQHLGLEFPRRYIHPCELACRGTGGSRGTLTSGPGASRLVARFLASSPGETGFLVPVMVGEPSPQDEEAVLTAGARELLRRGSGRLFVPVLGADARLESLLTRVQGVPRVSSEFWSKEIAPHPDGPGPRPTALGVASG